MLESRKHVFWQAFMVAVLLFLIGLVFGIYLENSRGNEFNTAFYESEVSLYDSLALSRLLEGNETSCEQLTEATIQFADRIYGESRDLEKFDEKNRLTESIKTVHRKYDLLRTLLWMNAIEIRQKCSMNTVVYLYTYDTEDIGTKSKQVVWSRILSELKEREGGNVILIPIASDSQLASLDLLVERYGVQKFPAVIVNEENIFYEISTVEELERYLN